MQPSSHNDSDTVGSLSEMNLCESHSSPVKCLVCSLRDSPKITLKFNKLVVGAAFQIHWLRTLYTVGNCTCSLLNLCEVFSVCDSQTFSVRFNEDQVPRSSQIPQILVLGAAFKAE